MAETMLDVFWHEGVLAHETGRGVFEAPPSPLMAVAEPHPENADRIRNMRAILERGPLAPHIRWHSGERADLDVCAAFHDRAYLESLRAAEAAGGRQVSPTTWVNPGSVDAALAAAGTALAAMDRTLDAPARIAYALVRPPGHHAQPARADGYCLINNVALCALRARARGAARVAIIDWDVHHGNGTQEGFYDRDDVLAISLHMDHGSWGDSHPQTGKADEMGRGAGLGFTLNVPLPFGSGDKAYETAMREIVIPAVDAFAPEAIVVAAGQDASQFDPNGRQLLSMAGFRRLGAMARALAERHCEGRLCLVQEGGYAVSYAAFCLHATLEGALGLDPLLDDPLAYLPEDPRPAETAVREIRAIREKCLNNKHEK